MVVRPSQLDFDHVSVVGQGWQVGNSLEVHFLPSVMKQCVVQVHRIHYSPHVCFN